MRQRRFHSITLGCKLNQFDTAAMEGELTSRGYLPAERLQDAAVVVVNTCTVTGKADSEARRIIRSVRRDNPDCRLLVTGCYAESDAAVLEEIPGVDAVFGNTGKKRIGSILDRLGLERRPAAQELPAAIHLGNKSRAFLKVQEGCNLVCAYCIVPQVRGRSRSVPPEEVEKDLIALLDAGYHEVVLTGINTGDYGGGLAQLLRRLLPHCTDARIRLNSLEPLTVTDEIVELFRDSTALAPHLQVPLQSGSDDMLRLMRRNYRIGTYAEKVEKLRREIPEIGLGADVVVGFPGETDEMFDQTYAFIESSPLNYLHVFSFSPRKGTAAASMPGRVHGAVVKKRSAALRELAVRLGHRFRRRFVGKRLQAVVLGARKSDGMIRALTGNYIEVLLRPGSATRRELVNVRITEAGEMETRAELNGPGGRLSGVRSATPHRP